MKAVIDKLQTQIDAEWDYIADLRSEQIRSGQDLSYKFILVPSILRFIESMKSASVLDVGCGCGFLTERLGEYSAEVVGIDPSIRSIELARRHCSDLRHVTFAASTIEQFAATCDRKFDLAVANMSLMAVLDLPAVVKAIASLLRPQGHLVFTLPHPCFWPDYWNYSKEWFRYEREIVIEAPFVISLDHSHNPITTHVHRPLHMYVEVLASSGFVVTAMQEPMPSPDVEAKYPEPWSYPRFLAGSCRLLRDTNED